MTILRRTSVLLLLGAVCRAPHVVGEVSASNVDLLNEANATLTSSSRVHPLVAVTRVGSVAVGCSTCRDSGNCSSAMNDSSSGVFCGDLRAAATMQPCCCPYYTECRVTSESLSCECGGASPFAALQRHERLASMNEESITIDHVQVTVEPEPEPEDPMDNQMAVSTEILIHLSAYLALFVFAVYVDQCVECFSDCRRNQMVVYRATTDQKLLRFRQRFGKRRQYSEIDTETNDDQPLLVVSPAPSRSPAFTFGRTDEVDDRPEGEEVVVVTVSANAVQEVSAASSELQDVKIENVALKDMELQPVGLRDGELQNVEL